MFDICVMMMILSSVLHIYSAMTKLVELLLLLFFLPLVLNSQRLRNYLENYYYYFFCMWYSVPKGGEIKQIV